jgi:predicted porin
MKFKTTAIAMAVAGVVAAPVAAQAADEIYASARIGVWAHKDNGDNNTEVKSFSSRFGAKGETDLGNGLTAFGRFEWDIDFQNGSSDKVDSTTKAVTKSGTADNITSRLMFVGLKGDFGSVQVGRNYQTFYNFAVGPNDIPWWHSGYAMVDYRSRTDRALTYAGSSGDFNFGATAYLFDDPSDHVPDQAEFGASMAIGDMTLGGAVQWTAKDTTQGSVGNDKPVFGLSLSGINLGMVSLGLGAQMQDDDHSALVQADIGNAYVHVEYYYADKGSRGNTQNAAGDADPNDEDQLSYTLGYTQTLGRKTLMYYEANYTDRDGSTIDNHTAVMAVLKYDII